jgi:dTDP-4-amino-4,6-dideoxygalactose transaminase
MINIPFNNLKKEYLKHKEEYDTAIQETLLRGNYILGPEVKRFEENFANFIGTKFCIGLNSGLDALIFALKALGIGSGDEVIVPANTYIATVIAISEVGARPVLVEPDEFYNINPDLIEVSITNKTKAIMVVHLYGQSARMREIKSICNKHSLFLVEDCAQSHGSKSNDIMTGTWGDVSCFSFYPTKNLGAFGDGGACLTNNTQLANQIRLLRNYGSKVKYHNEIIGMNSRLDELQAAVLNVKLSHLEEILKHRSRIANHYLGMIINPKVYLPIVHENSSHVWHLFVLRVEDRDGFQKYLNSNGIETVIHYPIPPHLSKAYEGFFEGNFPITEKYSNTLISLPLFDWMELNEAQTVIDIINLY